MVPKLGMQRIGRSARVRGGSRRGGKGKAAAAKFLPRLGTVRRQPLRFRDEKASVSRRDGIYAHFKCHVVFTSGTRAQEGQE